MIADKNIAAQISALMLEIGGLINESLAAVKARSSAAEFERYQRACDTVLMDLLMEIVSPIHERHPELLAGEADEGDRAGAANRPELEPPLRDDSSSRRLRLVHFRPRPQRDR